MTETSELEALRQRLVDRTARLRRGSLPLRGTFSSLRNRSDQWRGNISSWRSGSEQWRGTISSWRGRGDEWRRSISSLRNVTREDVVVFFPKLANRLKAYWRRRQDNADLVKTMNSIQGEEARIEKVCNLVDELDWWRPDLVAQHCGEQVIMPIVDASISCWGTVDRMMAPLKHKAEFDSEEDILSLPSFHPLPPPRKLLPVPPPRRFYSAFVDASPVPPPRKKNTRINQVRNIKAPPRPPRRHRGRKIKILRVQPPTQDPEEVEVEVEVEVMQ